VSDATANALREARRSLADLVTALPEPVWREHKGVFENAVDLMVGENLNIRADDERLGAALAAAEARCARLEPYEWRCLAAEQKVNDLAADLHAAERAHREAEAALAAAETERDRLIGEVKQLIAMNERMTDEGADLEAALAAAEAERDALRFALDAQAVMLAGEQASHKEETARRAEAEARAERCRAAVRDAVEYFESEHRYGPLYEAWEHGEIGNFDDRELSFAETLEAITGGRDVRTGIVQVEGIDLYRCLCAALADASVPRSAAEPG
jgi:hypothetical protein